MTNNEIALSFEQAEYYTLQEACDYLNMKHGINNITVKKIIKNILKYETNIYFYARGFNVIADLLTPISKEINDKKRDYMIGQINRTKDILDTTISDGDGLLLLLRKELLERFRFSDIARFYDEEYIFCGVLSFDRLQDSPFHLEFLKKYIDRNIIDQVLSIYPHFYKYSDDEWSDIFTKSSLSIERYDTYNDDDNIDKEYAYTFCKIGVNELIILHKDLITLENNIVKNNPAPQKHLEIKKNQPRKGVSIPKLQAKEQAKLLAKALWNNDKEKAIRVKEMANRVYAELYDSGFKHQLPQSQDSLQEWIKDIAPPHAKIGGRPKNKP